MNTWKQDTPSAMAVTITPEIAAAMLATSSGNRAMRMGYVQRLAGAMTRGEWRITSQAIGFDTSGALRDGHHRLSACIRSGVPIKSMLVVGMPATAYQVIDTGAVRSYADRLGFHRHTAEVLTFAAMILQHGMSDGVVTVDQILPLQHTSLIELAESLTTTFAGRRAYMTATPVRLAACMAVMQGQNQAWVWRQYRALAAMDFECMTPASMALVRQVQHGQKTGGARVRLSGSMRFDTLARGLRVFDQSRCHIDRIQVNGNAVATAVESVRETLRRAVAESAMQQTLNLATP